MHVSVRNACSEGPQNVCLRNGFVLDHAFSGKGTKAVM
jgi:hypothetical protein